MAKDENKIISPIEKNPFYKHFQYDIKTPINLTCRPHLNKRVKKHKLKSKIMLKKSSLPYIQNNTKNGTNQWLSQKLDSINDQGNWTKNLKRTTIKNTNDAYNFDNLLAECGKTNDNNRAAGEDNEGESKIDPITDSDTDELTNVNELTGYMENILHIPKNMTQMAEMMYL